MARFSLVLGLLLVALTVFSEARSPTPPPPRNCQTGCPFNLNPVCGSNGVTYPNICVFENAKCQDTKLTLRHEGECRPGRG